MLLAGFSLKEASPKLILEDSVLHVDSAVDKCPNLPSWPQLCIVVSEEVTAHEQAHQIWITTITKEVAAWSRQLMIRVLK